MSHEARHNDTKDAKESLITNIIVGVSVGVLVAVIVGIGSAIITSNKMTVEFALKIAALENAVEKHENTIREDSKEMKGANAQAFLRLEDHERRLVRLETTLSGLREDFSEVKRDIKSILHSTEAHRQRAQEAAK